MQQFPHSVRFVPPLDSWFEEANERTNGGRFFSYASLSTAVYERVAKPGGSPKTTAMSNSSSTWAISVVFYSICTFSLYCFKWSSSSCFCSCTMHQPSPKALHHQKATKQPRTNEVSSSVCEALGVCAVHKWSGVFHPPNITNTNGLVNKPNLSLSAAGSSRKRKPPSNEPPSVK